MTTIDPETINPPRQLEADVVERNADVENSKTPTSDTVKGSNGEVEANNQDSKQLGITSEIQTR